MKGMWFELILLASKNVDMAAFYSEWLYNRLMEGFFYRYNKRSKQYDKILLTPDTVDCIVLSTKNPEPFFKFINSIKALGYNLYFKFTLTPYGNDLDCNISNKRRILQSFKDLSSIIGSERIEWHYGPVLLNDRYTLAWHKKSFEQLSKHLSDCTEDCSISFSSAKKDCLKAYYELPSKNEIIDIVEAFSVSAKKNNLVLKDCSENINMSYLNIERVGYVDFNKLENLSNYSYEEEYKNKSGIIDCGLPKTCLHGCAYCLEGEGTDDILCVYNNKNSYPVSPLLIGMPDEKIKTKSVHLKSLAKNEQISF